MVQRRTQLDAYDPALWSPVWRSDTGRGRKGADL